ncbi:transporter [Corynebacterium hindlerae]|uniref:Transporter n=1 Tax=Corynebacterium hindlerae TaxID=699041 RepID=A0A7G5FEC3_9CORY|nr:aspartate:alanine exchanger family transporter [Corynebacterium hindlerae]QMV84964.1 transporter [Corynebacterium hindlerae]
MQFFVENQLLALVVIMALGLLLGRIQIGSFKLGVAAVLFVGLGFATIEPAVTLPPMVYIIGLALFVYTIGLEAGPDFFHSLRTTGLKYNLFAVVIIVATTALAYGVVKLGGLNAATGTGMFTGALTNTPAMAAAKESLPLLFQGSELAAMSDLPVVAYSLAYPLGVLVGIIMIGVLGKLFRVDHDAEAVAAGVAMQELITQRIRVDKPGLPAITNIPYILELEVIVSRRERDGDLHVPDLGDRARVGDILSVVGTPEEIERAIEAIGTPLPGEPTHDDGLDYRRIFVSNPDVVGIPLSKLRPKMSDMLITRIRRGDDDMVATPDMTLLLGDRVRVVTSAAKMDRATKFFGDSYKLVSDINLIPLLMGLTIGVLVGMIAVPLPGGMTLKLGNAGGPLLVALILGALGRTGPFVWQTPYSALKILQTLGLTLFLAGIGTTAGAGFSTALSDPTSLTIIGLGAILTLFMCLFTLVVGHLVLRLPFGIVSGIFSGVQTHPAILGYSSDQARNELPAIGYTTVYPLAMVLKIIMAQILLFALV